MLITEKNQLRRYLILLLRCTPNVAGVKFRYTFSDQPAIYFNKSDGFYHSLDGGLSKELSLIIKIEPSRFIYDTQRIEINRNHNDPLDFLKRYSEAVKELSTFLAGHYPEEKVKGILQYLYSFM